MTDTAAPAVPSLPQERRVVTAIPGPRSTELFARRNDACARGVGTTLPVFIERAGGGVLVDVDGNSLIDLGAGIAVVSVGNARRRGRRARARRRWPRSRTPASWSRRTRATWRCARRSTGSRPATSRRSRALFNSGAEAVENAVKIARVAHRPRRGRRVRPRLPRPHQPDDGDDREEHAVQARLRAVRRRGLPRCRWPTRSAGRPGRRTAAPRRSPRSSPRSTRRSAPTTSPRSSSSRSPGEGGFIVPARGLPARRWPRTPRENGIVFVADEIQTGFARTGAMFACEHEGVVPDLITTAKGIAGGLPLAAVTGRAEIMDAAARRRPRRHLRRQPGRLRGRARRHRDDRGAGPGRRGARASASACCPRCATMQSQLPGHRRRARPRRDAGRRAGQARHPGAGRRRDRGRSRSPATREGVLVLTAGTYGNVLRFLPPLVDAASTCSRTRSTSSTRRSPSLAA